MGLQSTPKINEINLLVNGITVNTKKKRNKSNGITFKFFIYIMKVLIAVPN